MSTKSKSQSAKASRKKTLPKTQAVRPATPADSNGSGPSTQETLRRLYTSLLRCRLFQEDAQRTSSRNYEIAIGHEAITVAPTAELTAEDTITATDSNLSAMVTRGVPAD